MFHFKEMDQLISTVHLGHVGPLWGTDGPKEALREGQGCLRPWFSPPFSCVGFRLARLAQPGIPIPTFPSCLSPGAMAASARNTACLGSTAVRRSPPLSLLSRPKSVPFWKQLAYSREEVSGRYEVLTNQLGRPGAGLSLSHSVM